MGIIFSKLKCNCRNVDKICKSKVHCCICIELINCRHGIKKFGRCIEKSRICFDDNREEIKCLATKHKKNVRIFYLEQEEL